jgi:integration host factor subunit beta
MKNPVHPGRIVRHDCLEPLGLSVTAGAKVLGVTRQALNNVVNGKSGISPKMASTLALGPENATCAQPLLFEKVMCTPKVAAQLGCGQNHRNSPYVTEHEAMTKADLIEEVSQLAELTRKDSEVIVETIFDSIVRSLRVGDKIEIRGFGSFRTRQRKPRVGRNPKTGDRVEVPAKKIPFFKPSKELKDLVNTGTSEAAAPSASPV